MQVLPSGVSLPFEFTDGGGNGSLDVAMKVYDTSSGSPVLVSTSAMVHTFHGTYVGFFTPLAGKTYLVNKTVYTNGSFTTPANRYASGSESFYTTTLYADLTPVRAANLDNLDATISSRESDADASSRFVSLTDDVASVQNDTTTLLSRLTAIRAGLLDNLDAAITSRAPAATALSTAQWTNLRAANLDNLDALVSSREAEVDALSRFGTISADTAALLARLTLTRAANLDNLDATISSRASQASVDAIQNNTRFVGVVAPTLVLPETGTKDYKFFARLFDEAGNPEDPDTANIDIRIELLDGTVVVATAAMTRTAVGRFEYLYTVNATDTEQALAVFFEYAENSVSFQQVRVTEVQEFESKLSTLLSRITPTRASNLDNLDAAVSSRESEANAALRAAADVAEHNATQAAILVVQSDTDDIQAKIGTPVATVSDDIAGVKGDTATLLGRLTIARTDNLDNLDVAISSRESELSAASRALADLAEHDTTQAAVAAVQADTDDIQAKIGTPVTTVSGDVAAVKVDTATLTSRLTAPRAANLDNLDATISSRESEANAASRASADQSEHDTTQAAIAAAQLDIDSVKSQTDQIVFDSGRVVSKAEVVSDKTGYELTGADKDDIVDRTWDEAQSAHVTAGSFGSNLDTPVSSREAEVIAASRAAADIAEHDATQALIGSLPTAQEIADAVLDEPIGVHLTPGTVGEAIGSSGTSPAAIASAVWDELSADHMLPGSLGLYIDVIRQFVEDNNNILTNGTYGPQALRALILSSTNGILTQIDDNEVKIDQIIPAVNLARDSVNANIDGVDISIANLSAQLFSTQGVLVFEINQNETKIDALSTQVGTIQNNTTTRFIVPSEVYRPELGTKDYQFHLRLYDSAGNPEAPDSVPTIRIRRLDTGVDIVAAAVMTQLGANVGAYFYTFTVGAGSDLFPFLAEATVVEGSVSRLVPAVSEIVEFQSDLDAIQTAVAALDVKTSDVQLKVNNPTFGLSALQAGQTGLANEVNQNEVKIDAVKAKTDLIPANIATQTDVNAVGAAVLTRPAIADIITQLNLIRDSIKGSNNRDNTEVYDHFDISSVAKTSDPRLAFLDAAVSSRSTLTAPQVWAHATRTLTSVVLAPVEVAKIWDYLASDALTAGSIGKLLSDILDAKISTRATQGQVASLLSGVAQESTVSGGFGATASSLSTVTSNLTLAINLLNLVKAKTDNLPSTPASEATLQSETSAIDTAIANLSALSNLIKTATDRIPLQPATEGSVSARPTNPVLDTDPRLNRLDANISSRSTLSVLDLAALVDDSQFNSAISSILGQLTTVLANLSSVNTAVLQRPTNTQMDTKLVPIAKSSEVAQSTADILSAVSALPSGLTAAQIWGYAARTLTASPTDISSLATATQLAALGGPTYHNRMATVWKSGSGVQEIIAWAEKNGQRVLGTNCAVFVKNASGVTMWTATLASPNADGVFKFTNPMAVGAEQNYYVVIEIVVDSSLRRSHQPFFTVG